MDLHIHTCFSDGSKTPIEILKMAQYQKLEYISITDHDNCFAYEYLDSIDISKYYSGKIIPGIEIMTCIDGIIIEILGYGIDWRKLNTWSRKYYSLENIELRERTMFKYLKEIILHCPELNISKGLELPTIIPYSGYFKYMIYEDILKYEYNTSFLENLGIHTYEDFLRKGLYTKSSPIFFNQEGFLITVKKVVELIHNSGGLAFLAHLYKYPVNNHIHFLENIMNKNIELDGIETSYSSFTKIQENEIINFARKNNLYLSGGSDYHGKSDRTEKIGYGTSEKRVPKIYLEEWYNKLNIFKDGNYEKKRTKIQYNHCSI